jgi:uncharacterized protein (DUF2147 family)
LEPCAKRRGHGFATVFRFFGTNERIVPMTHLLKSALVAVGLVAGASVSLAQASEPSGVWAMSNGKVTVKVSGCGKNLCANIVGLKEPISKIDGKPKVDRENPDPSLRKRPLIGLSILIGMKPAGDGEWKGAIYNPDDGKTYSATVRHQGDRMKVKGCVASVFCKTNTFVKVN